MWVHTTVTKKGTSRKGSNKNSNGRTTNNKEMNRSDRFIQKHERSLSKKFLPLEKSQFCVVAVVCWCVWCVGNFFRIFELKQMLGDRYEFELLIHPSRYPLNSRRLQEISPRELPPAVLRVTSTHRFSSRPLSRIKWNGAFAAIKSLFAQALCCEASTFDSHVSHGMILGCRHRRS